MKEPSLCRKRKREGEKGGRGEENGRGGLERREGKGALATKALSPLASNAAAFFPRRRK